MAESQKYYLGDTVIYQQYLGSDPIIVDYEKPVTRVLQLDAGNLNSYPTSGSLWTDLSPEGNNVTLSSVAFSTDGGGSLDFNDLNSQGACSTFTITDEFTTNIWFKLDRTSERDGFFGAVVTNVKIIKNLTGNWFVRLVNGGSSANFDIGYDPINMVDEWHMFTIMRGSDNTIYGSLDGAPLTSSGVQLSGNFNINRVGDTGDGNELDGHLAVVLIDAVEFTDTQVLNTYNIYKARFGY